MVVKELLELIKKRIQQKYDHLLVKVILFGSRAGEKFQEDSDYDILLVVSRNLDWREKESISDVLYDISIEMDIIISVSIFSEQELSTIKGKQMYIQNAFEHGIAV